MVITERCLLALKGVCLRLNSRPSVVSWNSGAHKITDRNRQTNYMPSAHALRDVKNCPHPNLDRLFQNPHFPFISINICCLIIIRIITNLFSLFPITSYIW